MKQFVAVFEINEQAFYALFDFQETHEEITAVAQYVRTWPDHVQLPDDLATAALDCAFDDFIGPMENHIRKEMKK